MRAAEAAAARERAGVEAQLKAELDRLKFVATQTRKADESEARRATDQIKQLEGELARVHAQAEERQAAQLEELRAQMAEMREAAAQQARAAAAEAVASEVARAAAQANNAAPRKPNVVRMQPRAGAQSPPASEVAAREIEKVAAAPHAEERSSPAGDYYSLFQPTTASALEPADEQTETAGAGIDYRRHAKWALPVAACLLLVTNTGTAISTVTRFVTPDEKPALIVQPVNPDPFIEVVEQRVGSLKVESTPEGAEAIVDGHSYGKTPLTIPDLEVGAHARAQERRRDDHPTRHDQEQPDDAAVGSDFLRLARDLLADSGHGRHRRQAGQPHRGRPGDDDAGQARRRAHQRAVQLSRDRNARRAPGETTAHTLTLPMGSVRVTAPEGAEIKVDGAAGQRRRRPKGCRWPSDRTRSAPRIPRSANGAHRLTCVTALQRT